MRHRVDSLKIVNADTLPVGTFFRAIGSHGVQPPLAVVVERSDGELAAFALEGDNSYSLARITNLRGYACSIPDMRYIELPDAQATTTDRYNAGQLAITEHGAYIIGEFGPQWQRSNVYVHVDTWTASLDLGDFADPTCFDEWSMLSIDEFGNAATVFNGKRIAQ